MTTADYMTPRPEITAAAHLAQTLKSLDARATYEQLAACLMWHSVGGLGRSRAD
jgi:hypothetical protein